MGAPVTATEVQAETDRLRGELRRFLRLARMLSSAPEVHEQLATMRRDFEDARGRMLEEQKKALRASLPPPERGLALRLISAHLSLLNSTIPQLDAALQSEAA